MVPLFSVNLHRKYNWRWCYTRG